MSHIFITNRVYMKLSIIIRSAVMILPLIAVSANADVTNKNSVFPKENNTKISKNDARNFTKMKNTNYITESGSYDKLQDELNKVYFDFDKSIIKPQFAKILDEHAKFLLAHPAYSIMIEGHADERGSMTYNLALGERRALAVKNYLQAKGVQSLQLYTISFGEGKLAALGHDAKSHQLNRRAVLVY